MPEPRTLPDHLAIAAAVVLTAALFLPAAADPVNPVKLLVAMWAALAGLALVATRAVRYRSVRLPSGAPASCVAGLAIAFSVSTVVAPVTATAVVGAYGRNSGLLAYLSALVLLSMVLTAVTPASVAWVCYALMAAGGFTATYGFLQRVGVDAIPWSNPFNPIIASLGNPDFASGYLGICIPVAAWAALHDPYPRALRAATGLLAVFMGVVAALSGSIQGPLGAAAGLSVLLLAWSLTRAGRQRRLGLLALAGVLVVGLGLVVVGSAGYGPAASALTGLSFRSRLWYGEAALRMFRRHPLLGVGLDSYGDVFRQVRPVAATRALGGTQFTDAAHDVPLQMLAQGGVLLGIAYLAYVTVVATALVRGLRAQQGTAKLLLGGVGGAWIAAQLQSFVSIDQVPLIVAQYVLGGATLVAAGGRVSREFSLPGRAVPARAASGRRRPAPVTERVPPVTTLAAGLLVVIAVATTTGWWLSLKPLRADISTASGDQARVNQRLDLARPAYQRATELMPGISRYWARLAALYNDQGQVDSALTAYEQATRHDPYDVDAWRNTGRLADAVRRFELAKTCFSNAARLDPDDPATVLDLARFELRHGGAQAAQALLQRTLRVVPDYGPMVASLGDTQAVLGDPAAARRSYRLALKDNPGDPTATAGLAKLDRKA